MDSQTATETIKQYAQSIHLGNLTPNPGYFLNPNITSGTYYSPSPEVESPIQQEQRKELHKKTWVYFAKMFAEKHTEWDLMPDPANPITNSLLRSKNRDFCIENTEHGIRVIAATGSAGQRVANELHLLGPTNAYTLHNRHVFYGWALGLEDAPDFIVTP